MLSSAQRLKIIVLGYMVRGPLGGMVWSNLQYLMALARLGHDVYFFEDSDDYPSCYDPTKYLTSENPTYGLQFASETLDAIGFGNRWTYYDAHTNRWLGPCGEKAKEITRDADLVLNLCGVNPLRPWLIDIPVRVLVDEDPAFTQIRFLSDSEARENAAKHNRFFTFGENFGKAHCSMPEDGFLWKPTRQPIVLDRIEISPGISESKWTTVMQWQSYPAREHAGRLYGMKSESFLPFMDFPGKTSEKFELALGTAGAPRTELKNKGWHIQDPFEVTSDPWIYQSYIRRSKGEFGIAKQGYVMTSSGWFSERSACYLACGRPVLHQETGFTSWYQGKEGLLPFTNQEDLLEGLKEIHARYDLHCRKARDVAEAYFDSDKILRKLIQESFSVTKEASAFDVNF